MKNNFSVGTRVSLRNLGGDELLEGATGIIAGKSFSHPETDFYIVILDCPLYARGGEKAISMIESCIEACPEYDDSLDGKMHKQYDRLLEELRRVKSFINENGFDCTTAPFAIAKEYRDNIKRHLNVLRDNLKP